MREGMTLRMNFWMRGIVPGLFAVGLLLFSVLPLGLPYFGDVRPLLILIAVFYWSIFWPELMPAILVFAIGLGFDLLAGGPPGIMALVLLLVRGVCISQHRPIVGQTFLVGWLGFSLIAVGAYVMLWLLHSVYYFMLFDPQPLVGQFIITVLFYPLVAWAFTMIQSWISRSVVE